MENFGDLGNKSYVKARQFEYSSRELLQFKLNSMLTLVQAFGLTLIELLVQLVKFFNSVKPKNISGQTAVVTGGANGLGRAIAFRLAMEKANVVIVDLNFEEAQKTADDIANQFGVASIAFKVDVSDFDAVQRLKIDIEDKLGPVEILVNNAGILSKISLRDGQPEDIKKLVDVNLTSHLWTIRTFLDSMISHKRGHIVAISSLAAKMTLPLAITYCATKFGVRGLMSALFDELCVSNHEELVNLTTVYPWFISTRKELIDVLDTIKEVTPRMTPEFVADEVVKGMLLNKTDITLPNNMKIAPLFEWLPGRVRKFIKSKSLPGTKVNSYR